MATNETVTLTAELKDQMSAPLDKAIGKVDNFTDRVVDGAKQQAKASDKSTAQITSNTDKTAKKYGGLLGVFAKVGGAGSRMFDGMQTGLRKAGGAILTGAKKIGAGIGKAMADGIKIGGAAAGAAFVTGLTLAAQKASADSMLTAQMGLSPEEAARVGKVSGQLYASGVGSGIEDINTALEASYKSFGRYGTLSNDELAGAATKALAVAQVLGVDVSRAAQVAGTMIRNELAGNATEAFDLIMTGTQNAAAGMGGDVLDALDEYSTFFTSMGFSGQEAMGLLSEASHGGVMALDKVGDSIKEFGIRSTDGSKATATAFETLGMRGDVMANRFVEGGTTARKAFKEVTDALLSVKDPATRAQTAIALFGTPLEDMDVTLIPAFLQSLSYGGQGMEDFAGRAQAAADTLNSGAGFEIEKFKRESLLSLQEFAMGALPYVKPFFDFLRDAKDWLPPVALGIAGFAVAMMGLNAVLSVTAAVGWPVTLVVLALFALAAAAVWAYNNIDWFKDGVDAAFKWIGEAAVNVWNWIQLAFNNVISFWQTNVAPVIDWLVNTIFRPAFDWIGRFVWNTITIVVTIFTNLLSFWNTHLHPAITVLATMFAERLGPGIAAVGKFIEDVQKGFGIFMAFIQAKFAPQIEAVKFIFDRVAESIGKVLEQLGKFGNNPLGGIQDLLGIKKDANGQGILPGTLEGAGADGSGRFSGGGVVGRFAGGGVLGGYAPGRDSILARLSPGESVLVPELTRQIGAGNIMAANANASGGRPAGAGPTLASGYSNRSRGGGTSTTVVAEGAVQITVNGGPNGVSAGDIDQIRAAVEQIFAEHNRRSY